MYRGIKVTPPFFEIGPKAYLYGKDVLRLARHADRMSAKYHVQIIFTPQYVDIPLLAHNTRHLLIFAQHMDSLPIGRGIGSVLPEAVKAAGAAGVLLNHAEKKLTHEELERTIHRADEVGLASMVCADNLEEALKVARMSPNIIVAESPDLIGVGKRGENDRASVARINTAIWDVNPDIRVLHGAGISCGQASAPFAMLEEMIRSVRTAWDAAH
jgi:triosephosphate isomerase